MSDQKQPHTAAYIYAIVAVLFWATSASAFKLSLRHVGVLPLLFLASATSTIAFGVYLIATKKLHLLKAFTKRDYLWSAGLGFLNPFLYYVVLFKAYSLLPAQEAQPINFVWPLTLVLLSIPLLGQRIRFSSILAIIISFAGVVVIATHATSPADIFHFRFSSGTGVLLALSTTVVWALFWIYNTKDRCDEAVRLFVNFAFATGYILIALLLTGRIAVPEWQGLVGGIYVGLFEMGITFLAWLKALKTAKTTAHVVNLIYLVPFLSLMVIALVLGEEIRTSTMVVTQRTWG
jgi:drug/metabolite transporter (DMT)-like permease